jgi:hypothetical protein
MRLTQKDYKLGLDMKNVRNEFTIHNWNSAKESVFQFFGGLKRVKMHARRY